MYVCMFVTGLRLVYAPLRHVPLMMPSRWRSRTRRMPVEDYARTTPDVRRQLTAQQKDEDNGARNDLHVSTRVIYLARWPMNGIGRGQHGIVSTVLWASPFCPIELSTCSAWGTWCTCVYLVTHAQWGEAFDASICLPTVITFPNVGSLLFVLIPRQQNLCLGMRLQATTALDAHAHTM